MIPEVPVEKLDDAIAELQPGCRVLTIMSAEAYHDRPEVSSGFVRCVNTDGMWTAYHRYILRSLGERDSDPYRLGSIFHLAAPSPETLRDKLWMLPEKLEECGLLDQVRKNWAGRSSRASLLPGDVINTRLGPHKEYLDALKASAKEEGMLVCTEEEFSQQQRQVVSLLENPVTNYLFGHPDGQYEKACFYRDQNTGLVLKALADLYLPPKDLIVDWKTTRWHTRKQFVRAALKADLAYHTQAAFYRRCFGTKNAGIVAVRNFAPEECMYFDLPPLTLAQADALIDHSLGTIKRCIDHKSYHSEGWGQQNLLIAEEHYQ